MVLLNVDDAGALGICPESTRIHYTKTSSTIYQILSATSYTHHFARSSFRLALPTLVHTRWPKTNYLSILITPNVRAYTTHTHTSHHESPSSHRRSSNKHSHTMYIKHVWWWICVFSKYHFWTTCRASTQSTADIQN